MTPDPESARIELKRSQLRRLLFTALVVVLVAAAGGAAAYVSTRDTEPEVSAAGEDGPGVAEEAVDVDEPSETPPPIPPLFTDPESFLGQDLHVVVTADEIVHPNSFRAIPTPDSDPEPSLLVVYSGLPVVEKGMALEIEGTITGFTSAEVDEQLGSELPEEVYAGSSDEFALVARTVTVVGKPEKPVEVAQKDDPAAPASDPVITPASGDAAAPVTSAPTPPPPAAPPSTGGSSSGGSSSGGSSSSGSGGGSSSQENSGSSNEGNSAIAYTGDETRGQYSDAVEFEATVTRAKSPVRGAKVVFELRGDEGTRQLSSSTNRDGVASVTTELTEAPGTYKVVAIYRPKDGRKATDKTSFVVEKEDTLLDLTAQDSKDTDEGSQEEGGESNGNGKTTLIATLSESDEGEVLEGQTINFFADGEFLGSAVTDASGIATFEVPPRDDRAESFEARFDGDDYFLTSEDAA